MPNRGLFEDSSVDVYQVAKLPNQGSPVDSTLGSRPRMLTSFRSITNNYSQAKRGEVCCRAKSEVVLTEKSCAFRSSELQRHLSLPSLPLDFQGLRRGFLSRDLTIMFRRTSIP